MQTEKAKPKQRKHKTENTKQKKRKSERTTKFVRRDLMATFTLATLACTPC